ncbi:MAG: hypothetical protein IKP88_19550 [Lachnospiraceae bacterium]|nr:hypothetical protein [Lachnospiraceae bacterium]
MKLKFILSGFFAFLLGIFLVGSIPADAASQNVILTPSTKQATYTYVYVSVSSPIEADKIAKIEMQYGKVTKTSNKKWKNTEAVDFYSDDDGSTIGYFYVNVNGTYSVRLTTTDGKKYASTIKIKNILPASANSAKEATITKISSKPNKKGYYTVTVDYETPYNKTYDELVGLKVGDTLSFNGKDTTIISMFAIDDNYDPVPITSFSDACRGIVCQVKDWKEFYPESEDYREDPQNQTFGLISRDGGLFIAYDDYEYAPDCYVKLGYTYPAQVKLKINKNTKVYPAYFDREMYPNGCEITADVYLSLLTNKDLADQLGIYIYPGTTFTIFEKYNKKTGKHTSVIAELHEIYYP